MADGQTFSAGQARLTIKPQLSKTFRTDLKGLLEPIKQSLDVTASPKLANRFRTDLKELVKTASAGINAEIGIKLNTTGLRRRVKDATKGMPDVKVDVNIDLARATAQMETFRREQAAIPLTLNANVDTAAAVAQLLALRALAGAVGDQVNGIGAGGAGRAATRLTGNIITRPIRAVRLQVEIDRASVARAEAEVANIATRLSQARDRQTDALGRLRAAEARHSEVMARSNATESQRINATNALTRARREFANATGRVTGLMGQEADADNRLQRARRDQSSIVGKLEAAYGAFSSALGDAARKALSLSNVLGFAKVALIGLAVVSLVPLLGQLSQALGVVGLLPGMLAGAIGAFATLRVGFEGIGDAFSTGAKAAESAAKDAEAHAKAVASAQKQQVSAARSVQDAERGIATAERGVRSAQKETLDAQRALNKARKDAKTEIDDLNRSLGRTALNEEGAAIAVAEAQKELFKVFSDPNSDAVERASAQHRVKQALVDQQDTIRKSQELAEQAAEANAKGVEGSDQVVSAKERVESAAQGEIDAEQALADANTRLSDAQQALAEANQNLADEMTKSSDAAEAFEKALGKLSPSAQDFVRKMLALKPALGELRAVVQQSLFDRMGDTVTQLANNWLPTLAQGLRGIAIEINGGLRRAFADLDNDATRSKVSKIFDNIKDSIGPLIDGLENLVQGILSLTGVSSEFLPGMSNGFVNLTERFRKWAESPEGQDKFRNFLEESIKTFGQFMRLGRNIIDVIREIFRGSDQTGESWMDTLVQNSRNLADFLGTPEGQQKIRDFFTEVEKVVKGISDAVTLVANLLDRIGAFNFGSTPLGNVAGLLDGSKTPGQRVGGAAKGVGQVLIAPWKLIGGGIDSAQHAQVDVVKSIMSDLGDKAKDMAKDVTSFWYQMGTGAVDLGKSIVDNVTTKAGGALDNFKNSLPNVVESVTSFANSAKDKFGSFKDFLFDAIGDIIGDNILGKMRTGFYRVKDWFGDIVSGIGSIWSGLVGAIQGPINAVIGVLNSFGDIWNKVADKLGLPKWEPIGQIGAQPPAAPAPQTGPEGPARVGRWMGGPIKGPGGPTDDLIPIMASNDEHMWTAAEVKAAGGHEAMYRMRQSVLRGGGQQSRDGNYAIGGGVQFGSDADRWMADVVQAAFKDATITSALRPGDSGFHGKGQAVDVAGPLQQIANWIFSSFPQSTQLIYGPGPLLYNARGKSVDPANQGELAGIYANDLAGHMDHVHWANVAPLAELSGDDKKSLLDRIRSGIGNVVNSGRNFAVENLLGRPLRSLADRVPDFPALGQFGGIPKTFARKMVDQLINLAAGSAGGSAGGGTVNYDPTSRAEQWRGLAQEAMRRTGFNADDPQQVNAMLAQINSESGGNPNILQQVIDVNSGGNEAQGLLQVIPGTFATYRDQSLPNDRTHPLANMVAALNYYRARYGNDLTTTWGQGHGYDQGGIFPHKTFGWNLSGLPEAVLTNPQWKMFQDFINHIPGFNNGLQALPQPLNGGTDSSGNPGLFGVPTNPGVETLQQVGKNAQDRFGNAFKTGLSDLWDSNLGALGIPNPTTIPVVKAGLEYGQKLDSWQKARQASAEASAALANANYRAATVSPVGTADAMQSGTDSTDRLVNDNRMTVNIYPADVNDAGRKMQQIAELRALSRSARGN
ncbi:transglycosylase SLT domain-containing protein [Nocardia sp. NPDC049707]|uniref:transglycosylase SLT domain-containing protein n=1 Tax=Nocardia sp. NPDC049707 TaxID=3154735 RepID=UPI00342258EE